MFHARAFPDRSSDVDDEEIAERHRFTILDASLHRRNFLRLGVGAGMGALLAACGGDDDDDSGSEPTANLNPVQPTNVPQPTAGSAASPTSAPSSAASPGRGVRDDRERRSSAGGREDRRAHAEHRAVPHLRGIAGAERSALDRPRRRYDDLQPHRRSRSTGHSPISWTRRSSSTSSRWSRSPGWRPTGRSRPTARPTR